LLPALRIPSWLPVLIAGLLSATAAQAHLVKQIFSRFSAGEDRWQADVTMDAGFAWPEFRDDPEAPQPTLQWLESRPPKDFEILRRESELLLRKHLDFRGGTASLPWTCRFPDFDSFPPDFPEILGGGAFLTVRVEGPLPPPGTPLVVHELTGQLPDFVFQTGPDEFPTLLPGQSLTLVSRPPPATPSSLTHLLWRGFTSVLPGGWDQALFILSLFLLDRRPRSVLLQSLTFITAHSLTLWLTATGTLSISFAALPALVALSVAFTAADNLLCRRLRAHRLPLIFVFGLLHGVAFSQALSSLPEVTPLLWAHLGLECAVVSILFASALLFLFLPRDSLGDHAARKLNLVLLLTGIALCFQRLSS
jgi:hypothetical protein